MKKNHLFVLALTGICLMNSAHGATLTEDFSSNPFLHGWKVSGDTNLFQWNSTDQNLSVTWDSAQGNSYFYYPLGTVLARGSDFACRSPNPVKAGMNTGPRMAQAPVLFRDTDDQASRGGQR